MPAAAKPSEDSADQLERLHRRRHVTCPLLPDSANSGNKIRVKLFFINSYINYKLSHYIFHSELI
jgi:hypothetical protein